jgi:hypothetical protein
MLSTLKFQGTSAISSSRNFLFSTCLLAKVLVAWYFAKGHHEEWPDISANVSYIKNNENISCLTLVKENSEFTRILWILKSWGSSINIVSYYSLDKRGLFPGWGKIFHLASVSRPALSPPSLLSNEYLGFFPGDKARPGRDADTNHTVCTEAVKIKQSCPVLTMQAAREREPITPIHSCLLH